MIYFQVLYELLVPKLVTKKYQKHGNNIF
jgi:hypothetical protein